jgi:hypothetical protein
VHGKREGKRPRRGWKDVKMDLRKIEWHDVDWIHLAQGRGQWRALLNTVIYLRVP